MAMGGGIWPVSVDGRPMTRAEDRNASLRYATPGYLAAMSVPVKRGRDVSESDTGDRRFVAVVSESFVRKFFPNDDPMGRHFTFVLDDREIVGIVGDVKVRGPERVSEPQVYLPYKQVKDGNIIGYIPKDLAIRTSVAPATLAPSVRAIIHKVDPKQPVSYVRTMSDIVELQTASRACRCACSARSRSSRSRWRASASTGCCRSRCRSARRRSACAWRWARSRATSSVW